MISIRLKRREGSCERPHGHRIKQPPSYQRGNLYQYHGCFFLLLCLSKLRHFDDFKKKS